MRTRQLALAAVSAAAFVAATAGTASAIPAVGGGPRSVSAAYACPNHYLIVQASALHVHTNHSLGSTVVGQLPRGVKYCLSSTNFPSQDGYTWAAGFGYNGGTRVAGWAVTDYLGDYH
jgi:hypothetical protein